MQSLIDYFFPSSPSLDSLLQDIAQPTLAAPNRQAIKEVMDIFYGNNQAIRSEFAFASLLANIHKSPHSLLWTFQIKNISLFDRLIQESLFCRQISQMPLILFDRLPQVNFKGIRTQKLVCSLWQLIRYYAQIVESQLHVLCFKRSQRKIFLKSLTFAQVIEQLEIIQSLFRVCLEVSKELRGRDKDSFEEKLYQVELVQYLALLLAHKFVSFYACALLCFQESVSSLIDQDEWTLNRLDRYCNKFQANSFELIKFLKVFRKAKGFQQFNYEQFNPFQNANLPLMIAILLRQLHERSYPLKRDLSFYPSSSLKVQHSMFAEVEIRKRRLVPRIICPSQKKETCTPFTEWTTSFSDSFPASDMMTLDLIMAMRKGSSQCTEQGQVEYDLRNQGEYFDQFSSYVQSSHSISIDLSTQEGKVSPITYNPNPKLVSLFAISSFHNVYSSLPQQWNQL